MAIKIEEGKYYRTRDGRKVGPMSVWGKYTDKDGAPLYDCEDRKFSGTYWSSSGSNGEPSVANSPELDLTAEWTDGPVRTVTRTEIVPGTYGVLSVGTVGASGARIPINFGSSAGGERFYDASELRAAATTFIELADALDEVPA